MNKILISLFMLVSFPAFGTDYYKCTTETGDTGKFTFRGQTREEAMMRSVKMCLSMRVQKYMAARLHTPSEERTILFMEDCVNHTFCVEKAVKDETK